MRTNLTWVTEVIHELMQHQREGLIMEIRLRKGHSESPVIVSVMDTLTPEEFNRQRCLFEVPDFHGRVEYHYGGGLRTVRVVRSLTMESWCHQVSASMQIIQKTMGLLTKE